LRFDKQPQFRFLSRNAVLFIVALVVTAGTLFAQSNPAAGLAQSDAPTPDLRLGSGDLLLVEVYGVADLKQEVRVNAKGEVWLPLVGLVTVQGLNAEEAGRAIGQAYVAGGYLVNPSVSVFVKEYATQGVSVMGEVQKPGIYPLLGSRRLFDAIAAASGLTEKAGLDVTIMRRNSSDVPLQVQLSSQADRAAEGNVAVYPGDTVVVSKAGIVYVVGEVRKPGGFVMENNTTMTVLRALALAEGLDKNASLNGTRVVRRTPEGLKEIPIPLKKMLAAKEPDLDLQADDVLFVPGSLGKSAGRRALETIMQMGVSAAIWSTVNR
jgi:polysaccharide export outer membrane protein